METKEQAQALKGLREPFSKDSISLLPKPTRKENQKGKCNECKGYHGMPAVHIDYVGHADLTHRLLDVDPYWSWEPVAFDSEGLPAIRRMGNTASLWIRLTVAGVTRLGVGTCSANKDEVEKELIGDALRNAAMRFGAALDLWSKSERAANASAEEETRKPAKLPAGRINKDPHDDELRPRQANGTPQGEEGRPISDEQKKLKEYIETKLPAEAKKQLGEWFTAKGLPRVAEMSDAQIESVWTRIDMMEDPAFKDA